jgi:hypothetical protein
MDPERPENIIPAESKFFCCAADDLARAKENKRIMHPASKYCKHEGASPEYDELIIANASPSISVIYYHLGP